MLCVVDISRLLFTSMPPYGGRRRTEISCGGTKLVPYSSRSLSPQRWFLYPPEKMPAFHPNKTTLSWFLDTYPSLPPWEKPVECTIHPGEAGCCRASANRPMYRLGFQAECPNHAEGAREDLLGSHCIRSHSPFPSRFFIFRTAGGTRLSTWTPVFSSLRSWVSSST